MKLFFGIIFLAFSVHNVIAQDSLPRISKEIKFQSDLGVNVRGGIRKGIAWLGRIDATLDVPTENLKLWKGGNFYFNFMSTFGKPFSDYSGDLQIISNIEAQRLATFFELWYLQNLGRVKIKLGIIDLNADFAYTDQSLNLINSSFGIQPTISANMPVSIFPVTAIGGTIRYAPSETWEFSAGIFDGAPSIRTSYQPVPDIAINHSEGLFAISELKYRHTLFQRQGMVKAGGWIHSSNFDDHHDGQVYAENIGGYLIMEQEVTKSRPNSTYVWMKTGFAPRECNIVRYFYGGGITMNGPVSPLRLDNISLGVASAILCNHLHDFEEIGDANETAIEFTLQKRFGFFMVQPDFQYIINPSGQRNLANCLFLILRTSVTF